MAFLWLINGGVIRSPRSRPSWDDSPTSETWNGTKAHNVDGKNYLGCIKPVVNNGIVTTKLKPIS